MSEWLIDIIKEWVLATFFTRTQILDSAVPLIVTGDPVPDSTGIYFAKGLYAGKLYYEHDHGTYFIWWDADCTDYNLSTGLGVKVPGFWWGPAKNIEGSYVWAFTYRGEVFVSEGYKYLHESFVNRGDPAAADFVLIGLTADDAFHELDLSAIAPAGAKAVALQASLLNSAINKQLMIKTLGNANFLNTSIVNTQAAMILSTADLVVPLNSNRKAEYRLSTGGWLLIGLTVKGWWF